MSGIEALPRVGNAFRGLPDAHALSSYAQSTIGGRCGTRSSRIHASRVLFRVGAFIHLHPDVADGLKRSGIVLFDGMDCSVVLFRDFVLAIQSKHDYARIKVVKIADPRDLSRDMPALARRMGNAWLTETTIRRRGLPGRDLKGRLLVSRMRDLLSMLPVAHGARIVVARRMAPRHPDTVHVAFVNSASTRIFLERSVRHAVMVAGPAHTYVHRGEGGIPFFAGSWARNQIIYSVDANVPASAAFRAIEVRGAALRVRSWLERTLAPDDLICEARSFGGIASA